MEYRCSVLGCLKTSSDGVKLHEFPFNNKLLLPVWIMATNRTDWLPILKSRICDRHFSIDDYEEGNKNNRLKPNACPMFNTLKNEIEDHKKIGSDISFEISSTSDVNFSDIDSDDLPDTPNTSDMKFSDDDSISNTSSYSNSYEVSGLDVNYLSSISDENFDLENTNSVESVLELDAVSLSSSITSFENNDEFVNQKCAVILCNENARSQFDTLFFINFPKDNLELCHIWWKLCGHNDKFNSSFKICSIHFNNDDFTTITIRRDGQLYRQTMLKNNSIVPSLYLLPYEYIKFTRKRKKSTNNANREELKNVSRETEKCSLQNCDKTYLKNGKNTLFFKFPLDNKYMLKKWLNSIGLSNWQPSETDRLCSDHFENYYIIKTNNVYELNKYAVPTIEPKNLFRINSECISKKNSIEYDFSSLEFNCLNDDIIMVEEKKRKQDESHILNSLKKNESNSREININNEKQTISSAKHNKTNDDYVYIDLSSMDNIEDLQPNINNTVSITKQYLESFEKEIAEEKDDNENSNNNIDLEYIYMDILNNENLVEMQPIIDSNNGHRSTCNKIELVSTTNEKNINNKPNITTVNSATHNKSISKVHTNSQIEFTESNVPYETCIIPKSKNNGNVRDYIYVDMLIGDDVEELLLCEKKIISKNSKKKIPDHSDILGKNHTKGVPKSIIYNQKLLEYYGEMLPPYCDPGCQLLCYYSIPGPQRKDIYKEFQMLHNVTEQNCKITQLIKLRMIKKKDCTFEGYPSYHLIMNNVLIKVCQTFFINTLGITKNRLDALLEPNNYNWYFDKDTALKANQSKQAKVISEPTVMTDFVKESLVLLDKDYNLYEPESDTEVSLENVPIEEYEKVFLYMKGIPRVLSSYQIPGEFKKQFFETSICLEYIYKTYSENYIRKGTPPPYTKRQFKKIYNQYMKTFLKMV